MIILLNIGIIGLVLLIAYWWANEGLFSALLHLVCVITAGALALAFWEPITMALLNGKGFDNYAWGIVLVTIFSISLLVLRITSDKIIPANIQFPTWANLTFGGIAGAGAGVLTIGLCLIGSGFIQSSNELMGYRGTARDENSRGVITKVGDTLWLDVANVTSSFFSTLSVGTLHPDISGGPLQQYNPRLDELSTLIRDSYDNGKGQLSLTPDAASINKVATSDDGMVVVQVSFNTKARDYGGQLILSSSQIRLIDEAEGSNPPNIYYPMAWKQEVKDGGEKLFKFDDASHYATSVPGRTETGIKFAFDTRDSNVKPKFIQIRGTRFELPTKETVALNSLDVGLYRGRQLTDEEILAARDPLGKNINTNTDPTAKIRKLRISTNGLPGTIEISEDLYFVEGSLSTQWTRQGVSAALAIKGIKADAGTAIVQLDVSPGTNAEFQDLLPVISPDSPVVFIDNKGNQYEPIGFILADDKRMQLTLTPSSPIRTMGELPMHMLTSSNSKTLTLLFQVTDGVTLQEFRVGDFTIGTCDIVAKNGRR